MSSLLKNIRNKKAFAIIDLVISLIVGSLVLFSAGSFLSDTIYIRSTIEKMSTQYSAFSLIDSSIYEDIGKGNNSITINQDGFTLNGVVYTYKDGVLYRTDSGGKHELGKGACTYATQLDSEGNTILDMSFISADKTFHKDYRLNYFGL